MFWILLGYLASVREREADLQEEQFMRSLSFDEQRQRIAWIKDNELIRKRKIVGWTTTICTLGFLFFYTNGSPFVSFVIVALFVHTVLKWIEII